jgi:hypothetical protein
MIILRILAALALMGTLAACGGSYTARGTGTSTMFNPVTGQPTQTKQELDVKVECTWFAPCPRSVTGGLLGGNAYGGVGYGYGSYYAPPSILPAGTVLVQGPGPGCPVVTRRLSGQENCVNGATPSGNSGFGSGYYYDPRTGTQQQYGFPTKIN